MGEVGEDEEVLLTPDVAVIKVTTTLKTRIMIRTLMFCVEEKVNQKLLRQESLYYNVMVYIVGVLFTVSIVAYAIHQTYQVTTIQLYKL